LLELVLMPAHSWEREGAGSSGNAPSKGVKRYRWEETEASPHPPSGLDAPSVGDESDSDADVGPQDPADELISYCKYLFLSRDISAKGFCTIMYWAHLAGIEKCGRFGFRPGAPSGHYNRHLNSVMPSLRQKDRLYEVTVPSYNKLAMGRSSHDLLAIPPHEAVAQVFFNDPELPKTLAEIVKAKDLPPAYFENELVRSSSSPPLPVSLFVDAVPYSNNDSTVGFWLVNEINQERVFLVAMRKQLCCACGCRGWDTYHAIWSFLRWSFGALVSGTYPAARHDLENWRPSECARAPMANQALGVSAVLLFIKGDWAE
jgi:hypothetical protein